ncbi:hypothetical protein RSJ21_13655 [Clostridium botulinum]|uniref:hypothetical protein n=1 Tax=Clostridium botulinum TaxID=1491 RepID=UPI0006A6FF6D|nr:hypothetical protein [Clostridium botulinum]AUN26242.1 hypothetical protein RSJ21_13655 [Clostridium botulinum]KON09815.1 hypothetical protein ACP52_09105 [Clostridium botulinum]MBY6795177.1 hypothetical protein [Clostridium botulinum]MBY6865889.1 hypothetical protein [Clostridium botulinum]MBY6906170.1 hypothetical protein [Clostridium botulinum]
MCNKQVKMYCVKLNLVRTKEEKLMGNARYDIKQRRYKFRKGLSEYVKSKLNTENWTEECSKLFKEIITNSKRYTQIEKELKLIKKKISELYRVNKDLDRSLCSINIKTKDVIAIGDNNLVRTLGLNLGDFTDKIITVKVGDMDDLIVDKIIKDGLTIINSNGQKQHYRFFTAGAGQTRTKKFMMILENENLNEIMLTLMNGLTVKEINQKGGININKFLAYLALNNSGSRVWNDFDIDKAIVVDDFKTMVSATVDYIDRKTNTIEYKDKAGRKRVKEVAEWDIEKNKTMDVPVPHFDGLGLILDKNYKKNMQVRLTWVKGLLTYFNVVGYCKENGYSTKVKDIYGKEWDIVEDNIQYIFTKSQFKLHKFYKDWEKYKENFKKYNCTANICMKDSNKIRDYKDMDINYQMLQQLIHMSDPQIELLTTDFKELIKKVHTDRDSQLEFLGATKNNKYRDYLQEALRLYPEMLKSAYVKKQISEKITSEKKKACSGKIKIKNSKRIFILSDPCAFCDWLFGKIEKPEGCLKDGEVYCNLYKKESKLDILRSPSLSFEHVIRKNVKVKGSYKWYETNGLYTSTHDVISKILAFDVDGDEALILTTDWIIDLVEEMIKKYDIKPIYFEMGKAAANVINGGNISKSLLFVYHKSNIGKVSNKLTNIWNDENSMEKYSLMQKLCAYNNDVIDSAKTLSIPKLPDEVKEVLRKEKYPYFFQYAKNKKEQQCKGMSNSVMDRICRSIESIGNTKFDYKKGFGTFRIKTLMYNQNNIEVDESVKNKYLELEKITLDKIDEYVREFENEDEEDMKKTNFKEMFYSEARKEFLNFSKEINIDYVECVDMIIKYTYKTNDLKMAFLWNVFGAIIINNLNRNINKPLDNGYMMCTECGKRVKRETNNQKRCKVCSQKQKNNSKKVLKTA